MGPRAARPGAHPARAGLRRRRQEAASRTDTLDPGPDAPTDAGMNGAG